MAKPRSDGGVSTWFRGVSWSIFTICLVEVIIWSAPALLSVQQDHDLVGSTQAHFVTILRIFEMADGSSIHATESCNGATSQQTRPGSSSSVHLRAPVSASHRSSAPNGDHHGQSHTLASNWTSSALAFALILLISRAYSEDCSATTEGNDRPKKRKKQDRVSDSAKGVARRMESSSRFERASATRWLVMCGLIVVTVLSESNSAVSFFEVPAVAASSSTPSDLAFLSGDVSPSCYNTTSSNINLECWLANLTIIIPAQTFSKDTINATISSMLCSDIHLGGINSTFLPPTSLDVEVFGVGVLCTAHWAYHSNIVPSLKASGNVSVVVNSSSLAADLALNEGSDGLAANATVNKCTTDVYVADITFTGGGISGDILELFRNTIATAVSKGIDGVACPEITSLVETNLTAALVQVNADIEPYLNPPPPPPPPPPAPGSENLGPNNAVVSLAHYVASEVVGANGVLGLNVIMNDLTNNSGSLYAAANYSSPTVAPAVGDASAASNQQMLEEELGLLIAKAVVTAPLSTVANVTVGILDISIDGLNTWSNFDAFKPLSNNTVGISAALDSLNVNVTFFVNVTVSSTDGTLVHDGYLYETGVLRIILGNTTVNASLTLDIHAETFEGLTPAQLEQPGCLLAPIGAVNISDTLLSTSVDLLQVNALSAGLDGDLDGLIDTVLALFVTTYSPAIPAFINGVLGGPIRNAVNNAIVSLLYETQTNMTCPRPSSISESTVILFNSHTTVIASMTGLALYLLIALIILFYECMFTRRRKKNRKVISVNTEGETAVLLGASDSFRKTSLALDLDVFSWPVRYAVPLILLANIVVFFSSNTSTGAGVMAMITLGNDVIEMPSLFSFSLTNSVHDMWKAGVYPLSLMIAVFSGAWPYIKLVLMMICWLVPLRALSPERRERLLMALDALGKWSLIDAYVLVIMMVAFRFHIVSPSSTSQVPAIFDIVVTPDWGFFSFLLATMNSLAMTHIILAFHRQSEAHHALHAEKRAPLAPPLKDDKDDVHVASTTAMADGGPSDGDAKTEALCSHHFTFGHNREAVVECTWFGVFVVAALLLVTLALVVVGSVVDSFQFEFKGAAGMVLAYLNDPTKSHYSLLSLGLSIPSSSPDPSSFGVRWIQVTFFTFAMVVPLVHLVSLIFLWLVPMRSFIQRRVFIACEILNAWSALEVCVMSVIAAIVEIEQFAQFIVGSKCNAITPLLKRYFDTALGGDDTCFDVIATLLSGCWILFAACIIYIVVGFVVMRLCHKALAERSRKSQRRAAHNHFGSSDSDANCSSSDGGDDGDNVAERSHVNDCFRGLLLDVARCCLVRLCLVRVVERNGVKVQTKKKKRTGGYESLEGV